MQIEHVDAFLENLESTHNVQARGISIAQQWKTNGPPQAQGIYWKTMSRMRDQTLSTSTPSQLAYSRSE